jgi:hypothetical protein
MSDKPLLQLTKSNRHHRAWRRGFFDAFEKALNKQALKARKKMGLPESQPPKKGQT